MLFHSLIFTSPGIYMRWEGREVAEAVFWTQRNMTPPMIPHLISTPALMKLFREILPSHQALDLCCPAFPETLIRRWVIRKLQSVCVKWTLMRNIWATDAPRSFPGTTCPNFFHFQKRWWERGIATWTNYGERAGVSIETSRTVILAVDFTKLWEMKVFLRSLGIVYSHLEKLETPTTLTPSGRKTIYTVGKSLFLFLYSVYVKLAHVILEYHELLSLFCYLN